MTSVDTAYNALGFVIIWGFTIAAGLGIAIVAVAFSRAAWSTFRPGGPDINVDADGHMSARTRKGVELLAGVGETFPEFFKRAADWADGNFPQATRASIAEHMRREVVELQDAITADTWGPNQAMRMELADVFLLLIHEARHNGLDGPQLLAAAQAKLLINQARGWGQADAQGVVEHVRTTSPMTAEKHNREHDGPIEKCHAGECQALMRELAQGVVEHVRTQGEALRAGIGYGQSRTRVAARSHASILYRGFWRTGA